MKYSREQIEQALANAEASLRMEGLQPSDESGELCLRAINEEITDEEFLQEVLHRCKP